MLFKAGVQHTMRHYWGCQAGWQKKTPQKPFVKAQAKDTTIGRAFYPFVHQPTMRGARSAFYRLLRDEYVKFIETQTTL